MGHPHHIPGCGQNLSQNTSLWCRGFRCHMWSCGHHVTITQPHTTQATSLADLGPEGSNPPSFPSMSILLQTDASLIAPQWLHAYLLSFLTQRLTVCAPVSCLHPCLLPPHADSCHSYRYPPASIPIAYVSL